MRRRRTVRVCQLNVTTSGTAIALASQTDTQHFPSKVTQPSELSPPPPSLFPSRSRDLSENLRSLPV